MDKTDTAVSQPANFHNAGAGIAVGLKPRQSM